MAMVAGDKTVAAGTMAKAIFDALIPLGVISDPPLTTDELYKDVSAALAQAIVGYIKANADVVVRTTDVGLQRDDADGLDTLGPSNDVTMAGPGVID